MVYPILAALSPAVINRMSREELEDALLEFIDHSWLTSSHTDDELRRKLREFHDATDDDSD